MPTSPLPRLKLASMQAPALITRASAASDGSCSSPPDTRRTQVVMIAIVLILIGGIPRGTGLQCAVIRQGPTGDHQPLCGSGPFARDPRLHPAPDQLDGHRPFLAVSYRQVRPRIARE